MSTLTHHPHTPPWGPQWDLAIALLLFFNPSPLYTLLRAHPLQVFPASMSLFMLWTPNPLHYCLKSPPHETTTMQPVTIASLQREIKESSHHRALTRPALLLFTQPQRPSLPAPWPQTLAHWARCPRRCLPLRRCPGVPPRSCPRLASLGPPLMQQPGMGQHHARGSGHPPRIEWCRRIESCLQASAAPRSGRRTSP